MVKQAAHDSSDECSIHSSLIIYPGAEIGKQGELKIRWYNILNVQVVFRIQINLCILAIKYSRPTSQEVKT